MFDKIKIVGAKENNLKNVSLEIDKHKFNVVTGVSGSGKSSLVFDCIYAMAQTSFYETLSTLYIWSPMRERMVAKLFMRGM